MIPTRVLIVDDEIFVQKLLSRYLVRRGIEVLTAGNGKDALALIQNENPPVVLLDLTLPDMSGLDVWRKLKELSSTTKVILMSGHSRPKIEQQSDSNPVLFLDKPFDFGMLDSHLECAA